jgi:hypothetical protein
MKMQSVHKRGHSRITHGRITRSFAVLSFVCCLLWTVELLRAVVFCDVMVKCSLADVPVRFLYVDAVMTVRYALSLIVCEILTCITKTALTYLHNSAGTNYELPEDDTAVSKHVAPV